jgi:hypothetical protein
MISPIIILLIHISILSYLISIGDSTPLLAAVCKEGAVETGVERILASWRRFSRSGIILVNN